MDAEMNTHGHQTHTYVHTSIRWTERRQCAPAARFRSGVVPEYAQSGRQTAQEPLETASEGIPWERLGGLWAALWGLLAAS
eukprot:7694643-Pyramimonas_sp.AAC.1